MTKRDTFSIAKRMGYVEIGDTDGGYFIPVEIAEIPLPLPLWDNWFGWFLVRWFKIRKGETTMLEMVKEIYDDQARR